jgi:hypothetical protein
LPNRSNNAQCRTSTPLRHGQPSDALAKRHDGQNTARIDADHPSTRRSASVVSSALHDDARLHVRHRA